MTGRTAIVYVVAIAALLVCYWFAVTAWGLLALGGVVGVVALGTAIAMHAAATWDRRP